MTDRERERGQIILVGIFDSFYTPGKILNWGPGVIQKNQVSFFFFLKRTFFSIWLHPQKDILRGKRNELIFRPPFPFPALTNLYFGLQTAYCFKVCRIRLGTQEKVNIGRLNRWCLDDITNLQQFSG